MPVQNIFRIYVLCSTLELIRVAVENAIYAILYFNPRLDLIMKTNLWQWTHELNAAALRNKRILGDFVVCSTPTPLVHRSNSYTKPNAADMIVLPLLFLKSTCYSISAQTVYLIENMASCTLNLILTTNEKSCSGSETGF